MSAEYDDAHIKKILFDLRYLPGREWAGRLNRDLGPPGIGMPERLDLGPGSVATYNRSAGQWVVNHMTHG
jgi:hypothetical protein